MLIWDSGPPKAFRDIFEDAPLVDYKQLPRKFRLEWGPIFYRGRLNGKAKILVVGQDPAADENVAHRIFVGTGGQRVQGFLSKLGITRSYIMINTFLYSINGQFDYRMKRFVNRTTVRNWRNSLLNKLYSSSNIEAILGFGRAAKYVLEDWPRYNQLRNRIFFLTHPTARNESLVLQNWNYKLPGIANRVTPDSYSVRDLTPYSGNKFKNYHLSRIPLRDFCFGVPKWMGNGNMAQRVGQRSRIMPSAVRRNPTIYWVAISDEG